MYNRKGAKTIFASLREILLSDFAVNPAVAGLVR
jgi:hypothetical protein